MQNLSWYKIHTIFKFISFRLPPITVQWTTHNSTSFSCHYPPSSRCIPIRCVFRFLLKCLIKKFRCFLPESTDLCCPIWPMIWCKKLVESPIRYTDWNWKTLFKVFVYFSFNFVINLFNCSDAKHIDDIEIAILRQQIDVFISYRRSTGNQLASLIKVLLQLRGYKVSLKPCMQGWWQVSLEYGAGSP